MLDLSLVMSILVFGRLQERRIENLFFYLGVHLQGLADLSCQFFLAIRRTGGVELRKPFLHLAMIRLEQSNGVIARSGRAAASSYLLLCLGHGTSDGTLYGTVSA